MTEDRGSATVRSVLLDARVAAGGVGRYARDLETGLRLTELQVYSYRSARRGRSAWISRSFTPWGRYAVGRRAARLGPDLVHSLHLESPTGFAGPVVVTVHDIIPLQHPASMPSPLARGVFRRILRRSIQEADGIIVPSTATKVALEERFEHRLPPVWVVPHGRAAVFSPCSEEEVTRGRTRFGDGRPYVAAISANRAHKNMQALEDVARLLSRHDIPVVCAGGTGVAPPLRYVGPLDDSGLRVFYGAADAFVSTSLIEGFGLPVLEALACGTPVVCGARVGALEWLAPGCLVVEDLTSSAIAEQAARLLTDHELRQRLSDLGLRCTSAYTVARMADATAGVYGAIVSTR